MKIDPHEIIRKAQAGKGLQPEEAGIILEQASKEHWADVFETAKELTAEHFQNEVRFFAPLYFSNHCINDCGYCGFKRSNRLMQRNELTSDAFFREADYLWRTGHRSLLLVAAEHPVLSGPQRIAKYLSRLVKEGYAFDIAIEVGPFEESGYRMLSVLGVSRVVLYQETYDRTAYLKFHKGPKADYEVRYAALGEVLKAGIENIGMGFLLGLYSWRDDFLNLLRHARQLESKFGRLPATFSFPRVRPAYGVSVSSNAYAPVSDENFEKLIALCRIAMPSVGITLTTRETANFRNRLLHQGIGVTHMSAGVNTVPGGYCADEEPLERGQFGLYDERTLGEVVNDSQALGYQPVFKL